jgi:hypothetical protein
VGARVIIQFQGIEETISRLNQIEEKAQQNLINEGKQISDDGKTAWKENTPEGKTGRLRGDEDATPADLSITFTSPTYYYKFVDEGHRVRKRGGGYAKRRVKGRYMTKALVKWLKQNVTRYLSKFLDNV